MLSSNIIDDVMWQQCTWARPRAPARHGSLHPPGTLGSRPTGWDNGLQYFLIAGVSEAPSEKPDRCISVRFIYCQRCGCATQPETGQKKRATGLVPNFDLAENLNVERWVFTKSCDAWYKQLLWNSTIHPVQLLRCNTVNSTLRFDSPACLTHPNMALFDDV